MTSPVGGARIEVTGDFAPFRTESTAELSEAGKQAAASFDKTFAPAIEASMAEAGAAAGEVFWKGADGRLRTAQGKFVSAGRAAAAGYTEAVIAEMEVGRPAVAGAAAGQGRAAAAGFAAEGSKAGEGFWAKLQTTLLGKHMITGAIFAGIGYEAVKMAGDFQTGMTRLVTAAGESQAQLGRVSAGTLQISKDTGVSAHELAAGMYMVESAGFHGQAGLNVMRAAAEGAKVDMADANVVANALTTVLTDMGTKAGPPAEMMSKLVATVGRGKMTMDDLASSIHSVLPNATAIGLSFAQTAGAIATMTAQGITAQQATQNLNHAVLALAAPTAVQTKAMAAFGLNATDVAQKLGQRGLTGTLDLLQRTILQHMGPAGLTMEKVLNSSQIAADKANRMFAALPTPVHKLAAELVAGSISAGDYHMALRDMTNQQSNLARQWLTSYNRAHGFNDLLKAGSPDALTYSAALAKMTGGQVGLQVALHLTGENMATYKANVKAIDAAHTEAGNHVEGWAIKQRTFNQVMSQLGATLKAALIELGQRLIPVLTVIGQVLLTVVIPAFTAVFHAIGWIYNLIMQNDALKVFVGIIAGVALAFKAWEIATLAVRTALVTLRVAMFVLNGVIAANPIALIVIGIAALAAGLVYAYQHFKPFRDIVDDTGRALRTVLLAALHAVETAIGATVGFVERHWKLLAAIFAVALGPIGIVLGATATVIYLLVRHFGDMVHGAEAAWHDTAGFFTRIYQDVAGALTSTSNAVTGTFTSIYNTIARILSDVAGFIGRHWRIIAFLSTGGLALIEIIIQDHWHAIAGFFTRIYQDVVGPVVRMWRDVTGFFAAMNRDVTSITNLVHARVAAVWNTIWRTVSGFASRIWHDVTGFFAALGRDVAGIATDIWKREVAFWTGVWRDVTGLARRLWHDVTGFFAAIARDVWAVIGPFVLREISGFENLYHRLVDFAQAIWHGVTTFFTRMKDGVVTAFDQMVSGIQRAWDKVKDVVAKPVRWVVDTVYDDGIVKVWNALAGALHEKELKLDPVHFAAGGMVGGNKAAGDWIPIYATAGEAVLNTKAVAKIGGKAGVDALNQVNGPALPGHFGIGGLISGGIHDVVNPIKSAVGDLSHLARGALAAGIRPAIHRLEGMADGHLNPLGGVGHLLDRGVHDIGDRIIAWAAGQDRTAAASGGAYGGGGGVMQWKALVDQVLTELGRSMSEEGAVLARIAFESGGNPNAINLTDSNARAGHPSQGLLQVIPSTFATWAGPYFGRGITDPLANLYAGINYADHRYGSMPDPRITHQGYDSGGILRPGLTLAQNNTGQNEYVITGDDMQEMIGLLRVIANKSLNMDGRRVTKITDDHRAYAEARLN